MGKLDKGFGPCFPGSFFRSRELNAKRPSSYDDVDKLWRVLTEEQTFDSNDLTNSGVLRRHTRIGPLYFRGQSDQSHGLSTSLHRFVKRESNQEITEAVLGQLEQAILDDAQSRGLGKGISSGQLLMILQHHSAPTRLMDVSLKPLEALYFAVEKNDKLDGRLFIISLNERVGKPSRMMLSANNELPWTKHVRNPTQSASEWTQSVQLVDEEPLDPRMVAQRGRFLVGGVQRAYPNLNMWFEKKQLSVIERQKISMLCMFFPLRGYLSASTNWPAIGWSIRIPSAWKPEIRRRLNLNPPVGL